MNDFQLIRLIKCAIEVGQTEPNETNIRLLVEKSIKKYKRELNKRKLFKDVYSKNHASEKQCCDCIYYVEEYKDKDKVRPACMFSNNYSFVSHNPARLCRNYEVNNEKRN